MAQGITPTHRLRPKSRNAQIRLSQVQCRNIMLQYRRVVKKACIRGDQLDRTKSMCVPPKGIFKLYSRWDPAAGRCKLRHRFDGSTCAGGKRRYRPGRHHAHHPAQSVNMYSKAPTRLVAAYKACQRGSTDLRSRTAGERLLKQRNCANARRRNDRNSINIYCK